MKRYLGFIGDCYYPNGGMQDFIGDFDTAIEAKEAIINVYKDWSDNWYQIWDCETRVIIDQG